jgi:hypothetical protein
MSTTDKTADKLVQSIRKTKTATPAAEKTPAVAAVSTTPPKSTVKKATATPVAKPATQSPAVSPEPAAKAPNAFQRRRVWPD